MSRSKAETKDVYSGYHGVFHTDDPCVCIFIARTLGEAEAFIHGREHTGEADRNNYFASPITMVGV